MGKHRRIERQEDDDHFVKADKQVRTASDKEQTQFEGWESQQGAIFTLEQDS